MNNVSEFNKIVKDLLYDMSTIIGLSYYLKFNLMININSLYFINKFKINILKYKNQILKRDPEFFLNLKNFNQDLDESGYKEYYVDQFYYLKEIYLNSDDESKKNLWDILKVLIFLCESYYNNKITHI
jgi:hypothetical protein